MPVSRFRVLTYNLLAASAIFLLLEIWRPYFFLTDDNLSQYFPLLTESGRQLQSGHSPFVSHYIFGGHYNLLRDCNFAVWHPLYLLSSLLADTPARFAIIDLIAFVLVLFAAHGFALLAFSLRQELQLEMSDAYLIFLSLSFTYSTFLLTTGSSWILYLDSYSALPWLAFALLLKDWRISLVLIGLLTAHQIYGAYMDRTILNTLFMSLFACGVTLHRRSPQALIVWPCGLLLGALVTLPILLPSLDGFAHAPRSSGWSAEALTVYSVPALTFSFSLFFGHYAELIAHLLHDPALLAWPFSASLAACAASWCLIPALINRSRWIALDYICSGIIGLLILLIIQPLWLAAAITHLSVLNSIRWPFRDILQFQFYFHLFLVLRARGFVRARNAVAIGSLIAFLLPLPFIRIPTLNPLNADRAFLFSGKAEAFWKQVKTHLAADDEIATVTDPAVWNADPESIPWSLVGTANFPAFLQVKSISGYSSTAPLDQLPLKFRPHYWFGTLDPSQANEALQQNPRLKLIVVESLSPLKITLRNAGPSPIDLTP